MTGRGICWTMAVAAMAAGLAAAGCKPQRDVVNGAVTAARHEDTFHHRPLAVSCPKPAHPKVEAAEAAGSPTETTQASPPGEAAWVPPARERAWRWIVVHHSATHKGNAAIFDDWHRNGNHWDELGYHFVIGNGTDSADGLIEVGSRWPKQKHGAHCKVGTVEIYNQLGIGVCLVGNFQRTRPTRAQMRSLVRLVDWLADRYDIPDSRIIGHGDVDDTDCPGRHLSRATVLRALAARRAGRTGAGG